MTRFTDQYTEPGRFPRQKGITIKLFAGYDERNKGVTIYLIDDRVVIEYVSSGLRVYWNDECYTEESIPIIKLGLLSEGFRF